MIPSGCGENARTARGVCIFTCLDADTHCVFSKTKKHTDRYLHECPKSSPSVLNHFHLNCAENVRHFWLEVRVPEFVGPFITPFMPSLRLFFSVIDDFLARAKPRGPDDTQKNRKK